MLKSTCCFTGHRPENLYANCDESELYQRILKAVENAVSDGYQYFLCGGSRGADFLFAEAVIYLRTKYPHIKLNFILPCRDQAEQWSREDRDCYSRLLNSADEVICLNDKYKSGCMHQRNRYMVDRSTLLIAAYNGTSGGTEYTYKYAQKKHLRIVDTLDRIIEETEQLSFL